MQLLRSQIDSNDFNAALAGGAPNVEHRVTVKYTAGTADHDYAVVARIHQHRVPDVGSVVGYRIKADDGTVLSSPAVLSAAPTLAELDTLVSYSDEPDTVEERLAALEDAVF